MVEPHKIFGRLGNQMFQGAYLYAQMKRGLIPDIYVQDYKYFEDCKNEIRQLYSKGIGTLDMVAMHIRRGDYVNNPFYVDLLKTNYYLESMKLFPNDKFLIFSDDIEYCKKIFASDCEFSEGLNEIDDLNKMASCKGIIMANSSFSWWAAYLSKAKVIAPKLWYTDGIERTTCPPEWIKV